jgi:hypothetical protein
LEALILILYVKYISIKAMYEMGAQLVSLNTQRADAFNLLMKGMFM